MRFVLIVVAAVSVACVAGHREAKHMKDAEQKDIVNESTLKLDERPREGRGLKDSLSSIAGALKSFNQLAQLNSIMDSVNVTEITSASSRVAKELSKSLKVDVVAVGKALAGAGAALGTTVFLGGMAALLATGLGFFNYSPRLYDAAYPFATYQHRVGPSYPGVLGQAHQAVYQRVQNAQQAFGPQQPSVGYPVPLANPQGKSGLPQKAPIAQASQKSSSTVQQPQYPVYHGSSGHEGRNADFGEVSARTARVLDEVKQPANPDLLPAIQDLLGKLGEAVNIVGPQVADVVRRRR